MITRAAPPRVNSKTHTADYCDYFSTCTLLFSFPLPSQQIKSPRSKYNELFTRVNVCAHDIGCVQRSGQMQRAYVEAENRYLLSRGAGGGQK